MKKLHLIAILLAMAALFISCPGTTDSGPGGGGTGGGSGNSGYTPPPLPDADVNYYVSVTGAAFNNVQDAIDLAVHSDNNGKVVHIHIDGTISEEVGINGMVEIADAASTAHIVLRGSSTGGIIDATGENKRAVYVNLPKGDVTFGDNLIITGGNVTSGGAGVQIINTPVVINGTTITGNTARSNGGGIYVSGNGTNLTIEKATISNNTAGLGSGIMLASATELTMKGGLVENNSNGSAINLATAKMTMSGGSIMNNTGGGVNLRTKSSLYLSGTAVITQNTKEGKANNVSKVADNNIWVSEAFASGANIGINTTATEATELIKAAGNYTITESDRKKIRRDSDNRMFVLSENKLYVPLESGGGEIIWGTVNVGYAVQDETNAGFLAFSIDESFETGLTPIFDVRMREKDDKIAGLKTSLVSLLNTSFPEGVKAITIDDIHFSEIINQENVDGTEATVTIPIKPAVGYNFSDNAESKTITISIHANYNTIIDNNENILLNNKAESIGLAGITESTNITLEKGTINVDFVKGDNTREEKEAAAKALVEQLYADPKNRWTVTSVEGSVNTDTYTEYTVNVVLKANVGYMFQGKSNWPVFSATANVTLKGSFGENIESYSVDEEYYKKIHLTGISNIASTATEVTTSLGFSSDSITTPIGASSFFTEGDFYVFSPLLSMFNDHAKIKASIKSYNLINNSEMQVVLTLTGKNGYTFYNKTEHIITVKIQGKYITDNQNVFYVRSNGSDLSGTGTAASPFASMARAASVIQVLNKEQGKEYTIKVLDNLKQDAASVQLEIAHIDLTIEGVNNTNSVLEVSLPGYRYVIYGRLKATLGRPASRLTLKNITIKQNNASDWGEVRAVQWDDAIVTLGEGAIIVSDNDTPQVIKTAVIAKQIDVSSGAQVNGFDIGLVAGLVNINGGSISAIGENGITATNVNMNSGSITDCGEFAISATRVNINDGSISDSYGINADTIVMTDGSIFDNLTSLAGSYIEMSGGTVYNNSRGVRLFSKGRMIMSGDAKIYSNGKGLSVGSGGHVTIKDSAQIYDNNNITDFGAGIVIDENATVIMEGGSIYNNTTTKNGGGVYVNSGATFTMTGGSIYSNTANSTSSSADSGGGVFLNDNATMRMSGGTIGGSGKGNLSDYGGGVYVSDGAKLYLSGRARITHNDANEEGGGVRVYTGGTVYIDGIKNPSSGGVYVDDNTNGNIEYR